MGVPRWKLRYGCDGGMLADAIEKHHMPLSDGTEVVLGRDYDSLREAYDGLKERLRDMESKALAAVYLVPDEKICGQLQDLRQKALRLLES